MQAASPIRLSALSARISDTLRATFQNTSFWVVADVTSHSFKASSNYHYFELVEKDRDTNHLLARFSAKAWGTGARQIEQFEQTTGQRFTNNIHVLVNVTVEYHPTYGLQLQVNAIDPAFTLGQIEQQRLATLRRLVTENPSFIQQAGDTYITRNNRLALKPVLQTLAVISARNSAGLQDFRHSLEDNAFGYTFRVDEYLTGVQGEANAASIRDTLATIFLSGIAYDAVIITRGGGSQTDLLMFDHYLVGQAIAKFPIPIITGIGHHRNTSIADLMAHSPTRTPTKAAEFIVAHNRAFEESLLYLRQTIVIRAQQLLARQQQALTSLQREISYSSHQVLGTHQEAVQALRNQTLHQAQRVVYARRVTVAGLGAQVAARSQGMAAQQNQSLTHLAATLRAVTTTYIRDHHRHLQHLTTFMKLMSPASTLQRGFALVRHQGRLTGDTGAIQPGDNLEILLKDTILKTTVTEKTRHDGATHDL
ncbi:exodeoxyribonuclease VII large subunit [Dawidia soli]|uniref:Exodeoxyribonuclease 7 large subunit n=1 Tax=Dawidia soli TaxID=2782352 RepID=A0AAP2DGL8_9BACT|nr:exodeoxyribonuclease VII large subunit [Dawidia soli]MBT1690340.1 exodeoxyribonuclease VII large subunit [Dawidia soli]